MTLNDGKCHCMCLEKDAANKTFFFKNLVMKNSKEQKMLWVTTDNKRNCKSHIKEICKSLTENRGIIKDLRLPK